MIRKSTLAALCGVSMFALYGGNARAQTTLPQVTVTETERTVRTRAPRPRQAVRSTLQTSAPARAVQIPVAALPSDVRGVDKRYLATQNRTATKSDTPTKDVPFSIQTVTPQMLDERRPADLARALETVPGVSVGYGGGFSNSGRVRIRGFSNVSNFKDGFRISTTGSEIDLANISSIEVLKGPASALYGRFEPGGIVNFVTKNPLATPYLETSVTGGSFGFARTTLDAGGGVTENGAVTSRINAAFERSDGFRDFTDYSKYFIAPALGIALSDTTTLTLKGEFLRYEGAFDRGLPNNPVSLTVPPSRNFSEPWMRSDKDQWLGSAELVHQLNDDWKVRLAAQSARTNIGESYNNYGFPPVIGGNITRTFIKGTERFIDQTNQAEIYGRVVTGPVQHKLMFGTEYNNEEWTFNLRRTAGTPISISNPVYGPQPADSLFVPGNIGTYKTNTVGFYAQDEMAIGPIRFLAGGRADRTRGEVADYVWGPNPPETASLWTFTPRLGLTYILTPELSVYGSWAKSTRLELDAGFLADRTLPKPTQGQQFEAGIKGNFAGGWFQPTLSLFDISKKNAIVQDLVNPDYVTQTGELKVRGVEVEVASQFTPAWKAVASYTYQNAYISEDTDVTLIGNQFQGVPKHQASLWTSYTFIESVPGLTVGGGVFFASERPTSIANTLYIPSFTRVDLFASYKIDKATELQLNVNNVTNERYYLVGGFGLVTPQPPLSAFATLKYRFL